MTIELYLTFVLATAVLIAIPGPNVALIVANSVAHGRRFGLITVAGTSAAMIPQLVFTMAGMTGALVLFSHLFEWLRWIGVAYLVYLGVQAIRAEPVDLTKVRPEPRSQREIFLRGFLVSLTNPKTLLFYGAFFPQFIEPSASIAKQLWLLSVTFLAIAVVMDACWALVGGRLRGLLAGRGVLRNRLTGGCYFAAALGLATARRGH
ncbi:MAG: LysE family translocator [Pseudomonadota bacterium]